MPEPIHASEPAQREIMRDQRNEMNLVELKNKNIKELLTIA